MAPKYVPPGLEQSFNCPHCGALSHQNWFKVLVNGSNNNTPPLQLVRDGYIGVVNENQNDSHEEKQKAIEFFGKIRSGKMFVGSSSEDSYGRIFHNLAIAKCYSCDGCSV